MRVDQRRVDARQGDLRLVRSRRPARRARRPRSPARRSAAPPAARPCTTRRRRRSSAAARAAARRPARRPSSRRRRTACRRGAPRTPSTNALVDLRGRRLVARDDLDLAAPQAGRDLQRVEGDARRSSSATQRRGDLGLGDPEQPQHPLRVTRGARRARRATRRSPARSRHIGCSSRGGPGSTTTVGPVARRAGGTTSPGAVPTGSRIVAPSGTTACLRLAARSASSSRCGQRCASRSQDLADALLQRARRAPSRAPANSATTSAVRSSAVGPEAAARDDQVDALAGQEAQRRAHVLAGGRRRRRCGRARRRARAAARTATARCGRR